jgi:glyoxylase-like metal-dependent hydrolase (beta-lactamase superfamily II)
MTTPGHTPGGICYRVEDQGQAVCFVGDTIFAGSIGGSNPATLYATHLESVRQRVLKLGEPTVLLPGHGPATTVREELLFNPFAEAG